MQSGVHCAICCRNRWSLHGETSLFTCHLSVCNLGVALKSLMRQRELCNILCDKYFSREISVGIVIKKSDRTQNPIFSMQELHWNFNLASLTSIPMALMATQTWAKFKAPLSWRDSVGKVNVSATPYSTVILLNKAILSRSRITLMASILGVWNVLSDQLIFPGSSLSINLKKKNKQLIRRSDLFWKVCFVLFEISNFKLRITSSFMRYSWTGYFWLNRQMSKYNFTPFYLDAQNLHVQLQSIYFFFQIMRFSPY